MIHISRVETIARESNARVIKFYGSPGFQKEGCFRNRIDRAIDSMENDIPMKWKEGGQDGSHSRPIVIGRNRKYKKERLTYQ